MSVSPNFAAFAGQHVSDRMVGFQKDIRICLTAISHPTTGKPTVAFSPALGTCCATLEYLTSLCTGRKKPGPDFIAKHYAKRYLPAIYDERALKVLYGLRNSVAHRGVVSGIWIDDAGERFSWLLSDNRSRPAIKLVDKNGLDTHAPPGWPCPYTRRVEVHLSPLALDIAASGAAYARDLTSSPSLLHTFRTRMEAIFPRGSSERDS